MQALALVLGLLATSCAALRTPHAARCRPRCGQPAMCDPAAADTDELAKYRAERLASLTPAQRKQRDVAYAKRLVARAPRGRGFRSEQKASTSGKGFSSKRRGLNYDRRPKADEACACGSGLQYGSCCSRHHGALCCEAADPSALVRARYTAYCYRLPDFLMATTDPEGEEFQADAASWKKSLLQFCDQMDFQRLEVQHVNVDASPPTVQFQASLVQKGTLNLMDMRETSEFIERDGKWFYTHGTVAYESPRA
ncbi:hypothetical protein AB1Y20_018965 [Prymnesium parvum]|uniref:YchJ-like middle NTF2-like domain-containing protein n=1 Tax=Prymnesium parvum TaxID=97485 RepID=A0AB34JPL4_PRYPA